MPSHADKNKIDIWNNLALEFPFESLMPSPIQALVTWSPSSSDGRVKLKCPGTPRSLTYLVVPSSQSVAGKSG